MGRRGDLRRPRARLPADPLLATGLEMFLGSLVLVAAAVVSGELAAFRPGGGHGRRPPRDGVPDVVGSLIAFTAFVWVIRHAPLPLVTTYAFVNPVIAVFLGWLLLHEAVDSVQLVAGGVIVAGVALIILARSRMDGAAGCRGRTVGGGSGPAGERPRPGPRGHRRGRRRTRVSARGQPAARPSATTVRATRRARAMIVTIGLTPIAVGNSEPSPT